MVDDFADDCDLVRARGGEFEPGLFLDQRQRRLDQIVEDVLGVTASVGLGVANRTDDEAHAIPRHPRPQS